MPTQQNVHVTPEKEGDRTAATRRLQELREELARGESQLAALDNRRQEVRDTMLRISGAIQVLEELLGRQGAGDRDAESSNFHAVPSATTG